MARAWFIRSIIPGSKTDYINEFIKNKYIAIGPNILPDLRTLRSTEKIRSFILDQKIASQKQTAGVLATDAGNFINTMDLGDLVLIIDGQDVYTAEITSDYVFTRSTTGLVKVLSHRREVNVHGHFIRDNLSPQLRLALKPGRQLADISKFYPEIYKLVNGVYPEEGVDKAAPSYLEVNIPLRKDFTVSFKIPSDMTKNEAERLGILFSNIYIIDK